MSTSESVDLTVTKVREQDVLFFQPDLQGFRNQLAAWWNNLVMSGAGVAWATYVRFPDFERFCFAALRVYLHLTHLSTFVKYRVFTSTESRIKSAWNGLLIPRYVRDLIREIARPMFLGSVSVVPYLALREAGSSDTARGFGIFPLEFASLNRVLQSQCSSASFEMVPIERESPRQMPFFVSCDDRVIFFESKPPKWRFDSVRVLRHVQRLCTFFDSTLVYVPPAPVPDNGFVPGMALTVPPLGIALLPQRPVIPRGQIVLSGVVVDPGALADRLGATYPAGPLLPLPRTLLRNPALSLAFDVTEMDHVDFDVALMGGEFLSRGLPEGFPVAVDYELVHAEFAMQARFPSLEEHSTTPPQSPRAPKDPVKPPSKKRKAKGKKKEGSSVKKEAATTVPPAPDPVKEESKGD